MIQMDSATTIRDAHPSDTPFLAKCLIAGMHYYDFETEVPEYKDIYETLVKAGTREDILYSYKNCRIAEVDGRVVGSLLSYPGDDYEEIRRRTYTDLWPDYAKVVVTYPLEADPGEYYLDTLAVIPGYRRRGIGTALLRDGIKKGAEAGYRSISLVADSDMPRLIHLYESVGFRRAEHRRMYGVDFLRMVLDLP